MRITVEELLQKALTDEVIIFQTDTVYGIGCLLGSEQGVEKIYRIKQRDGRKPLAVLCGNIEDVIALSKDIPGLQELAEQHWPGALTLVVPKTEHVPRYVTSGLDTVGVRIPNDPTALAILNHFGPMAVTSVNISSEPAILKYQDTLVFEDQVDYIIEGGDCEASSSTVYDILNKHVLRQGDLLIK